MKKTILVTAFTIIFSSFVQAQKWNVSVAKFKDNKRAAVSLTFDDGLAEHYTIVAPELEKRGFRGTFGVCGFNLNKDADHIVKPDRMTWPQVKELAQRGHEISNHGWAHRNHGRFSLEEIRHDIEYNDSMIEQHTGVKPLTFFYPNNTKRKEPMKIAERGRVGTRTFQISAGSKRTQEWFEHWLKGVIDNREWAVTMTHGITYGYDAFKDAGRLTRFLDLLKRNEDSLWVATLHDAMAYTKERDSVKLVVKGKGRHLKIAPQLPLDKKLFNYPLTMIVSGKSISRATASQDGKPLNVKLVDKDKMMVDFNPVGGVVDLRIKK